MTVPVGIGRISPRDQIAALVVACSGGVSSELSTVGKAVDDSGTGAAVPAPAAGTGEGSVPQANPVAGGGSNGPVAVVDDRLRTARELHDGVIQEIAYIRLESQSIAGDPTCRKHIVGACDRALDEARGALQTLGRTNDEPLSSTLSRALAEMAERYGFALVVDLDNSIEADSDQQHALTRIVREAVSNAVHHGKATSVRVSLRSAAGSRHMTIEDNGTGFDVSAVHEDGGYGLTSMRERARTLPGLFEVAADVGLGSQVTVRW